MLISKRIQEDTTYWRFPKLINFKWNEVKYIKTYSVKYES